MAEQKDTPKQTPPRREGLSGLLSRFTSSSGTTNRPRSSTASTIHGDLSGGLHASDSRQLLQLILETSSTKHQSPQRLAKQAKASRSVPTPTTTTAEGADAYGPYSANGPAVYLDLLKHAKDTSPATKCQYVRCLADSVQIYSDVDPLATWQQVAHLLSRNEHLSVREAALELLNTCVRAYDTSLSAFERETFYSSVLNYEVELAKRSDAEIAGLQRVCDSLSRGGRDIVGMEDLVETLCEWAGEMFNRRQAARDAIRADFFKQHTELRRPTNISPATLKQLSPLQDPSFVATYIAYPPPPDVLADDAAVGPILLLTKVHKFSWPQLSEQDVAFATRYLVLEALATTNDTVVGLIIDHIDVMSRFGYVPPDQIETVIFFLARVVSLEGRGRTISYVDASGRPVDPILEPFSAKQCSKARMVVKNLLRSSANQALKCLRNGTAVQDPTDEPRDPLVVIGCLACLRDVLNEISASPAYRTADVMSLNGGSFDSWPILLVIGLPVLYPNLCDALAWTKSEITEQVLLLLLDRLTPAVSETPEKASPSVVGAIESVGQVPFDEWDLILDLLERVTTQIRRHEDLQGTVLVLDLTAALANDQSESPRSSLDVPSFFPIYSKLLVLAVTSYYSGHYSGPLDRLLAFLFSLEPNLSDSTAVMLLDAYEKENMHLPTNVDWLNMLSDVISAFLMLQPNGDGPSDSLDAVFKHRQTRAAAVYRSLVLLADTYEAVRDFPQFRVPLLERVVLPAIEHLVENNSLQKPLVTVLSKLIRDVCQDAFLFAPSTSTSDGLTNVPIFDGLRIALLDQLKPAGPESSSTRAQASATVRANAANQFAICSLLDLYHCAVTAPSHSASSLAVLIFRDLLRLLSSSETPRRVRFVILQFLLRMRADAANRIFLTGDVDTAGLASTLSRFKVPDASEDQAAAPVADSSLEQERGRAKRSQRSPNRSEGKSRSMSRFGRDASRDRGRVKAEVVQPLWSQPEVLPFEVPRYTNFEGRFGLISFDHTLEWQETSDGNPHSFPEYDQAMASRSPNLPLVLPVSEYFQTLLHLIENETDWDLVAYILCLLPDQLSCKHFACGPRASRQIHRFRAHLCEALSKTGLASKTTLPQGTRRADLPQIAYQTLTTLIAYKTLFTKQEQDEMVESFIDGLTQRDIAKPCIHALAMCCHELQPSMTKYLSRVLVSLLKILSSFQMAVHILELIASIGQIPALFASFTDDDYRTIFGIALQYIILHNDVADAAEVTATTQSKKDDLAYAFSQYVFHLAFYVIDLWYMSMRLSNRRKHVSFIIKKLVQASEGRGELDEPSEVCIDMIARYAYADVDPHPAKSSLQELIEKMAKQSGQPVDALSEEKTWIRGHALLTIKSFGLGGWAEATVRRPSGTVRMLFEVEDSARGSQENAQDRVLSQLVRDQSSHLDSKALKALESEEGVIKAADVAAQFGINVPSGVGGGVDLAQAKVLVPERLTGPVISPAFYVLQTSGFPEFHTDPPLLVPQDERSLRSVKLLDNVPVVDFHKVAVLYVAPGDVTETDIFSNTHGSKDYVQFLSGLGKLVRLQGNSRFYLGGLDKDNDLDGKWAYIWDNNVSQIVYHVATLMPTDLERDPQCTGKKRHIGNDFVKVVFNDSGRPFSVDTIPGQFNFVTIIIEPQTPVGKSWMANGMSSNTIFFKVSMQRRADMPEIGPLGVFKMVSATCLPDFVRHLALHANVFAQVFLESVGIEGRQEGKRQKTEFVSNWRRRLQQIKQLKGRVRPGSERKRKTKDLEAVLDTIDFSSWT